MATGYINVQDFEKFISNLEDETEMITQVIKGDTKYMRKFVSNLQVPTYDNFQHYYFQDVLSMLSRKYIGHRYVIEYLQKLEDLS
jgi:hypothetical protein